MHSTFSEALERLLYDRFLKEYKLNIPDLIQLAANDPNSDHSDIVTEVKSHIDEYKEFQQRIRNGEFGKTPMFWLCLYLDLIMTTLAGGFLVTNYHDAGYKVSKSNLDRGRKQKRPLRQTAVDACMSDH